METNPYEYNTPVEWKPRQNQLYEGRYVSARTGQIQPPVLKDQKSQPKSENQKPRQPERMSKARALALADSLKKGLIIASFASFVTLSGLIANHQVSTTASTSQTSSGSSSATSTSTSKSGSSFFKQQGGNNFGTSTSSQGSSSSSQSSSSGTSSASQGSSSSSQSSSSGTSSASQTPVSGTHTS